MWAAFAAAGDADEPAHRLERGEVSLEHFFALMRPHEATARVLMDPLSEYFVPAGFEPHAGMHDFVREVRDLGLKTAVITNSVVEWTPWWERVMPRLDLFDVVVHSCQVGMRKPNPAIYRWTLERLGVQAHETMFLDDFAAMADSARAVGMLTVHVEDHAAAIAQARRHVTDRAG